jgi:ketosteroid isomerase-like protein
MSSANVRLVQGLYDAFKHGEIATIIDALTPDVDWQVHGNPEHYPTVGRWTGQDGAQEFFRLVAETEEMVEFSPRDFYAVDDQVFTLGRYAWKVRKTGKPLAAEWCHVLTITNGKVSRFREFTDTASFADSYRA